RCRAATANRTGQTQHARSSIGHARQKPKQFRPAIRSHSLTCPEVRISLDPWRVACGVSAEKCCARQRGSLYAALLSCGPEVHAGSAATSPGSLDGLEHFGIVLSRSSVAVREEASPCRCDLS